MDFGFAGLWPAPRNDAEASIRLLEFQYEIVDRHDRPEAREVVGVVWIAPEIAFADELEAGGLDFLAQGRFFDAMQRLDHRGALPRQRRMIGDDQNAARLECGEQFAV